MIVDLNDVDQGLQISLPEWHGSGSKVFLHCKYRENTFGPYDIRVKERLFGLIARLEGGAEIARTDALDQFVPDETLEELIGSIERDITADRPAAALDRLHTYCAKKFGHLLDKRSVEWSRDEPLQSRVGKYVKAVHAEKPL
jgi:hypothetical protein